jgi:methylated-DNA-protein-cysteine methyltransferase related protein
MADESYYKDVFELVKLIPSGRVTTYGAISYCLNLPSPRMVGWALYRSSIKQQVPAHRVVNSNGILTGRLNFSDPNMMQTLLEKEGIKVEKDKVKDFKKIFWDPNELTD